MVAAIPARGTTEYQRVFTSVVCTCHRSTLCACSHAVRGQHRPTAFHASINNPSIAHHTSVFKSFDCCHRLVPHFPFGGVTVLAATKVRTPQLRTPRHHAECPAAHRARPVLHFYSDRVNRHRPSTCSTAQPRLASASMTGGRRRAKRHHPV